jgi:cathepsin L/xylem cysteine proteinase
LYWQSEELIEAHNSQVPEPKYKLGHNDFSDMTRDEYAQYNKLGEYGNAEFAKLSAENQLNPGAASATHRQLKSVGLPDYVNWIALGGVTPVKNQGKKIHMLLK